MQFDSTLAKQNKFNFSHFSNEVGFILALVIPWNNNHFIHFWNNIHGSCGVSYDVATKEQANNEEKILRETKNYRPKYCGEYTREMFNPKFDRCFRQIAVWAKLLILKSRVKWILLLIAIFIILYINMLG